MPRAATPNIEPKVNAFWGTPPMPALSMVGGEIAVNTSTAGGQYDPAVTSLANGGFVVTWYDLQTAADDPSGAAVRGQLFDADGDKVGGQFLVNTATAGTQYRPDVTGLPGGGFVIAWTDVPASGSAGVKAQLFDASGAKIGGERVVNTSAAYLHSDPKVTDLAGGGFVVSWQDGSADVRAQIFNAAAGKVGGEFLVNTHTWLNQGGSAPPYDGLDITGLANGGFVAAWEDQSDGSIRAQLYAAGGARIGGEFPIADHSNLPDVAGLANGDFVVSWIGAGATEDVRAQVFHADGSKAGDEVLVASDPVGTRLYTTVTALAGGGFVVGWSDWDNGQPNRDLRAMAFASDGSRIGGEFSANSISEPGLNPSSAGLANGDFVVAWMNGDTTPAADIKAQIFSLGDLSNTPPTIGGVSTGAVAEDGVHSATGILTAADPDPGAAFTWSIQGSAAGAYGGLSLDAAGKWSYTLNPALAAALTSADHPTETFTVKVEDDQGGHALKSVVVTVNGADSATGDGSLTATPDDNYFVGGPGVDTVSYASTSPGVSVALSRTDPQDTGGSGRDRFTDIDNITGSGFDDKLTGGAGANRLDGGPGNDTVYGGDGADTLTGGDGNDRLESGGFTSAVFNPANGHSYLYVPGDVSWSEAKLDASAILMGDRRGYLVTITSAQEQAFIDANFGGRASWIGATDVQTEGSWRWVTGPETGTVFYVKGAGSQPGYSNFIGSQPDNAWGTQNYAIYLGGGWDDADLRDYRSVGYIVEFDGPPVTKEVLEGDSGDDTLIGGAGAQAMSGGIGADSLNGGADNDLLDGGDGADTLNGGAGADTLVGGGGIDIAQFAGLRSTYAITTTADGFAVSGPDGADVLSGVEFLKFSDQTVDLNGAPLNTPPTISGTASGSVTEGGPLTAAGQLTASDPDPGAAFAWSIQGSAAGAYGTFGLDATGKWTYTLNPTLAAPLTSADHPTETFTVKVEDGQGGSDLQNVSVIVNGADSAAHSLINIPFTTNQNLSTFPFAFNGMRGIVTNLDVDFSFPTTGANAYGFGGASSAQTLTVTTDLHAVDKVFTLLNTEWGQPGPNSYASIEFVGDGDADYQVNLIGGVDVRDWAPSSWTGTINGTRTVNWFNDGSGHRLDMQIFNLPSTFLDENLVKIIFTDTGADGFSRLLISGITAEATSGDVGGDTPPTIAGTVSGSVAENGAQTATGQLTASDPDPGAAFAWSIQGSAAGAYGTFGLNATGKWTYTLDPALAAPLTSVDHPTETFTVKVEDGQGGSDLQNVSVVVNGADSSEAGRTYIPFTTNESLTHFPLAVPGMHGVVTHLGVSFDFPVSDDNAFAFRISPPGQALTVTTNLHAVDKVYTLLNTEWGQPGPNSYASVEFVGDGDADYTVNLIGGVNVRNWTTGGNTQNINGTTTVEWFDAGSGHRLDMQTFDLPDTFLNENLVKIIFRDTGHPGFSDLLVSGITAETEPVGPFVATPKDDVFVATAGIDAVSYAGTDNGVRVNLNVTTPQSTNGSGHDQFSGIHNLIGTDFGDHFVGDAADNRLEGGAGDDTLKGGLGDDTVAGGAGDDVLSGNGGVDTVSYADAPAGVTVALGVDVAQATGGGGSDLVTGFENLEGSGFADLLTGDKHANSLIGGAGDDTLTGGLGADTLMGGAGADRFVFTVLADSGVKDGGRDVIGDFSHAEGDKIDLSALDADTSDAADTAFTLVDSFTHHAGELTLMAEAGGYRVRGDVDGDGGADFSIFVRSATSLTAADFVL
jgi:VCBS repeat-containing protein